MRSLTPDSASHDLSSIAADFAICSLPKISMRTPRRRTGPWQSEKTSRAAHHLLYTEGALFHKIQAGYDDIRVLQSGRYRDINDCSAFFGKFRIKRCFTLRQSPKCDDGQSSTPVKSFMMSERKQPTGQRGNPETKERVIFR